MTTPVLITSVFDGVTPVNLTQPTSTDPASEVQTYTPLLAGIVDFNSIGFGDVWVQLVATNPNMGHTIRLALLYQDGNSQLILPAGVANVVWNILVPQGGVLRVNGSNGAGGNPSGSVFLTWNRLSAKQWPDVQCCHFFAPGNPTPVEIV